ncbi:MAG: type IV pilin N-terminal domain-containing protein, partial [Thermoplasmata archaeon]|nr:type IV pilin N-terminal domain-containing protein [Thermoplasmata archaeon]
MTPRRFNRSDIKAVSEAIGTVLLLGISVTLAGSVALWTAQIDPGEEGLYVDLWADVQGDDLVLMHKGGDLLTGASTTVKINNLDGSLAYEATYTDHTTDVRWDPGDEVSIDLEDPAGDGSLPAVTDIFDVIVITPMPSGVLTVILSNRLYRTNTASGLPDLAITQVVLMDGVTPITRMNDDGTYNIKVVVKNFGADMTTQFFSSGADNTVTNLRLFDSEESIDLVNVEMLHHDDSTGTDLSEGDVGFGVMETDDHFEATFTWTRTSANPRALGSHTLNVKVVPFFDGELNYRNNYVERDYTVDKLVIPAPIFGPDPGIYDISFSNDAPSSGEEVTVTVIVQNSGDRPFNSSQGVNMIVSTWKPEVHSTVEFFVTPYSYDWRVDYMGHYGEWRSESPTVELVDDDTFPTCVKTDIELLPGAYFFYYFTLEARVDVPGGEQWVY